MTFSTRISSSWSTTTLPIFIENLLLYTLRVCQFWYCPRCVYTSLWHWTHQYLHVLETHTSTYDPNYNSHSYSKSFIFYFQYTVRKLNILIGRFEYRIGLCYIHLTHTRHSYRMYWLISFVWLPHIQTMNKT